MTDEGKIKHAKCNHSLDQCWPQHQQPLARLEDPNLLPLEQPDNRQRLEDQGPTLERRQ